MTGFFVVVFTFESVFPLACTGGLCDLSHRGLPGRCRPRFRRPCSVRVRSEGMTSPLSVERRDCRSGRLPDRDDETSPQTGVVAAVIFLIHVCGQIGLQDDRTKALTDQSTDGNLALLPVGINRRIEIGG